jgi:hypothetical protein
MPRASQAIVDHADELAAARFEEAEPSPPSDDQRAATLDLRDAVVERGRAEARVTAAVTRARAAGVSWTVIASVLGVSRQAAQQRYR